MKRIITAVATLLFGLAATTVSARSGYQIKGVVVDAAGPVIGATVMEQGTTNGTSTGIDGDYILTVSSPDAMVEVSCIGYVSQTFRASAVPASITLAEDTQMLADVVVIGYGTVKKEDMTGSITAIKAEELNRGAVVSTQDMLKGKVAGLQVIPGDGGPGSGSTLRLRGSASLNASNDPLVVIDGVPIASDGGAGMSNPLESLNPNDIESFTVLKDASSAAIYGSRASNGVIIITTKKGTGNRPQVSYNGSVSVQQNTKRIPSMQPSAYRAYVDEIYPVGTARGDAMRALMGNAETDWQKLIFRTAISHDHNISVYGNVKNKMPYRASFGYTGQQGTLKTSRYDRGTIDLSVNPKFLDEHLTLNLNAKGVYTHSVWADGGAVGNAAFYNPTVDPYWRNADGSVDSKTTNGFWNYGTGRGDEFIPNNLAGVGPLSQLFDAVNYGDTKRFIGNAQFDYKIHGFEALRINLNLGTDISYSDGNKGVNPGSFQAFQDTENPRIGQYSKWSNLRSNQVLELYANFNKEFGIHRVDAMAGYSWQHFYGQDRSISYFNGTDDIKLNPGETADSRYPFNKWETYLVSFYGRLNYSIASKYLFTFTLRDDASSRFSPKTRWGLFPSAAFAWNIEEEGFLKSVSGLSALKLRLSWGKTGQQEIGASYPYLARYTTSTDPYHRFNMGSAGLVYYLSPGAYDPDIRWETTTTYNAGLDWGLFGDRLTGTIDLYRRDTDDLLNSVITPMGANFGNTVLTNIGSMRNQGVEFSLNTILVETQDMSLALGMNGTFQQTEFTKLNNTDDPNYYVQAANSGISRGTGNNIARQMVGWAPYTFCLFKQVYDADGAPIQNAFVDLNEDGVISQADRYMTGKSPNPDFFFGLHLKLSYKNWDFGLNGHGSVGNYVFNDLQGANSSTFVDLNVGSLPNCLESVKKFGFELANSTEQYYSDMFLENASFFRLDDVNLGYTFRSIGNWKNANLRLGFTAQNLFVLTQYSGIDPELPGVNGIDGSIWPRPRTYSFRVNFNF